MILDLFIDLCEGDDLGPFLEHINFDWAPVPANANPEQLFEAFKGHYTNDGVLDGKQPFNDLATYPRSLRASSSCRSSATKALEDLGFRHAAHQHPPHLRGHAQHRCAQARP